MAYWADLRDYVAYWADVRDDVAYWADMKQVLMSLSGVMLVCSQMGHSKPVYTGETSSSIAGKATCTVH